tara:strand:- start:3708 stop:4037 length:330 start_codon:yes stop_codon:yes gene_type:complete
MTNAADMTIEEFSQSLSELKDRVINFKLYEEFAKDKRKNPRSTRLYTNAKRGDFHGKSKWISLVSHNSRHNSMYSSKESVVRQAISGLRELNNTVDTGKPKQNQMRMER